MGPILAQPTDSPEEPAWRAWSERLGTPQLEPMTGTNSALWRVRAADGGRYVLKRLDADPPAKLADQQRILLHLQARGVPVAPAIPTDDAQLLARSIEHQYALYPELQADHTNHDLAPDAAAICYEVGEAIAKLHKALAAYPHPVESFHNDLSRTYETLYRHLPADLMARTVEPRRDHLLAAVTGLPEQLVHGDCHAGNVLVYKGKVTGFVDVDHLPRGARVYDLCYYLTHRVRYIVWQPEERDRIERAVLEVAGRYVAGYHAANPLSQQEIAALVPAVLATQISLTEWNLHHNPDQPAWYEQGLASIAWIHDHYDELVERLRP
jgi:Ser/Thr protein kinase RdoA (MazF antagonist)